LYDPRGKSGTLVHATLTGHQSWVSSVKWSPGNENELVVVSGMSHNKRSRPQELSPV